MHPIHAYGWLNVTLGTTLALLMLTPLAVPLLDALAVAFPGMDAASTGADAPYARLMAGVAGGVWAGWGLTMVGLQQGWAPHVTLLRSVGWWYLLDGAVSAATGAWGNVVGNTGFLVLALVAVWLDRRSAATVAPAFTTR